MSLAKRLISNSTIVFVGTFFASIFSYLFNMLMGRMLGPSQYGELTALMSIIAIISVAGGAILTVAMKYSSQGYAALDLAFVGKILKVFSKYVLIFSLILFLVLVIFSHYIANFFTISNISPVIIALAGIVVVLLIAINRGVLQGIQKFGAISAVGIIEMLIRLTGGVLLVKIGLGLNGAIGAVVLATAVAYLATLIPLRKVLTLSQKVGKSTKVNKKEIVDYAWPTLLSSVLLAVSLNVDVLLVKHYFDPNTAGLYAALSTIGKIIFYATGPIVSVMFPMVAEQKAKGEKHFQVFLFSLLMTLVGALIILGIYVVAPGKVISVLYGTTYVALYALLPEVGLMILLYSLINLISNYYLAIKNFLFAWFFAAAIAAQIVIISLWHPSLTAVVRVFIVTLALLFAILFLIYIYSKKNQIAEAMGQGS